MLILSRKLSEGIMIGDEIEIRVTRIDHDSVRIGIAAPRRLSVYRDEIYKAMKASNLGAVRPPAGDVPQLRLSSKTPQLEPTNEL